MIKTVALVLVLVFAASVSAQTVVARLDLQSLGWGAIDAPISIQTDGNPETLEWLVRSLASPSRKEYRVVAERNGGLCAGDWFLAEPQALFSLSRIDVQRVGYVDQLVVMNTAGVVTVVSLDTPVCQ